MDATSLSPQAARPAQPLFSKQNDVNAAAHFAALSDDATVSVKVFAAIASEGVSTIWNKAKRDRTFPQPIRRGAKCTRFKVGEIRAYLAGPAKAAA